MYKNGDDHKMSRVLYGYARVSTREQNEERQIISLVEYGIDKQNIFIDKQSGKDFERKNYKRLIKKLKTGDVLVVKSIDRLGRNYTEIIEQWHYITQTLVVDIVVLDMPLLDTTKSKDLLGTLISDIVLQLLSYVAENERNTIRQRQAEGIAAAKKRGVKFGRPKINAADYFEILAGYDNKTLTREQAKDMIGCGETTFFRLIKEYRKSISQ